jgi:hypothetical protein
MKKTFWGNLPQIQNNINALGAQAQEYLSAARSQGSNVLMARQTTGLGLE